MSYQVLARKWRPKNFAEMVGQEHVLRALQNALTQNRLHHAYLFTGTRGVGKTTLARILAKCLNCDTGVTATPCGTCGTCVAISEGRMVDLIEVDAASRTKVEDTRELLENVQYAPTQGRYKVYIIDEVHMLTVNSFNALLKTLEEPPPHVKFLLATTDPQKLPVTVLSRCLQFHLKNMSPERIVGHLENVLTEENIDFEPPALWQLAHAADGSMRDALSLTDQAIGYGDRHVREKDVSAMLGTLNQQWVLQLLQALGNSDVAKIFSVMEQMSELSPDYNGLLADLIALLHRLAIAQVLPSGLDNRDGLRSELLKLATQIPSEDVQLFYQSALISRRDLPLSPSPRAGVEMALLRMLAFRPQGVVDLPKTALNINSDTNSDTAVEPQAAPLNPTPLAATAAAVGSDFNNPSSDIHASQDAQTERESKKKTTEPQGINADHPVARPAAPTFLNDILHRSSKVADPVSQSADNTKISEPKISEPKVSAPNIHVSAANTEPTASDAKQVASITPKAQKLAAKQAPSQEEPNLPPPEQWQAGDWLKAFHQLALTGIVKSIASNCEFKGLRNQTLHFVLNQNHSALFNDSILERLADAINRYFNRALKVAIDVGDTETETPAEVAARILANKQAEAVTSIQQDPFIQAVTQTFGAMIDPKNISAKV